MNLILIAPPAAGKGTQSELICNSYNINHISTGDLLREITKKNDEFSLSVKEKMEKGLLISDDIILKLIKDEIINSNNNIFDGFPRNLEQAKAFDLMLKEINQKIDYVIYMDIDKEILEKRISSRYVCPNCNSVYSFNEPDHECSKCSVKLIKRKDDTLEVYENRYKVYEESTKPIINYYKNQGVLYCVDADGSKEEVFANIKKVIGEI